MMKVNTALLAVVLALPLVGLPALAQAPANPPAKPAAKPPAKPVVKPKPAAKPAAAAASNADGRTFSLGGGTNTGPLLTRDELRACLQQEESIRNRLGQLDAERAALDQVKQGINADQQALRAERDAIGGWKTKIDDLGVRMKAYSGRVEAWNARVTEHNADTRTGTSQWERRRVEINTERDAIEAQRKVLDAEKVALTNDAQGAVAAYNTKAQALDARVTEWNSSNTKLNEASAARETERKGWVSTCADRRYREDDEKAIRAGK